MSIVLHHGSVVAVFVRSEVSGVLGHRFWLRDFTLRRRPHRIKGERVKQASNSKVCWPPNCATYMHSVKKKPLEGGIVALWYIDVGSRLPRTSICNRSPSSSRISCNKIQTYIYNVLIFVYPKVCSLLGFLVDLFLITAAISRAKLKFPKSLNISNFTCFFSGLSCPLTSC